MVMSFEARRFAFQDSQNVLTTTRGKCRYQGGPSPIHHFKHLVDKAFLLFYTGRVHSIPICPL
tara:strand:- start:16 stop:204 length:189 start_codon:yes stop_codon:yes gene_type:complete